ncbi:hypothetical protein C0416_05340 [bacterium]|nr:hypothetical protein [bacterium]
MNKLTIFFICATVLVIGVIGTLLGYRYFEKHQGQVVDIQPAQEVEDQETQEKPVIISEKPEDVETTNPVTEPVGETDNPLITVLASIDLEMILKAGFQNGTVAIEQFDGKIFNDYDISEYQDDEHIRYIIKEGVEDAGIVNELIYPSKEIAQGVYAQLKAKMSAEESPFTLNETNQYGEASFFANKSTETNSVFLVVNFAERLYTLHYPAKNHNKMKNLLQSL